MPSLDGFTRPSLDSIKQASTGALDKAKLMVGLNKSGGGSGDEDVESQRSENSGILEEVGEILCPELTFQQVGLKGHVFDVGGGVDQFIRVKTATFHTCQRNLQGKFG